MKKKGVLTMYYRVLDLLLRVPVLVKYVPLWYKGGIYRMRYMEYVYLVYIAPRQNKGKVDIVIYYTTGKWYTSWPPEWLHKQMFSHASEEEWCMAVMKGYYG